MSRIYSKSESNEWTHVYYVTRPPRRRDFLRVLLGRWKPTVDRQEWPTAKWIHEELKKAWSDPSLMKQFYDESPWLDLIETSATAARPIVESPNPLRGFGDSRKAPN